MTKKENIGSSKIVHLQNSVKEELPDFYVNQANMTFSVYDLTFTFGKMPLPEKKDTTLDPVVRIRMSPQHAKVFSKNLTSALVFQTQSVIDKNTQDRLYRYKKNFAQTLSKVKNVIPLLFVRPKDKISRIISDIHAIVVRTIEPIRPGRTYPRNFNNRSGRFHYCYQPLR